MGSSALIRVLRRPASQSSIQYAANMQFLSLFGNGRYGAREFSVFREFSNHLKGETKSNQEFQLSVKELNQKIGVVTDDLKVRTKITAEKLYKSVDDVWTEAEAKSKKVSVNVKEKLSAAKEKVSTNVKEKFSAAQKEVKEAFGLGKDTPEFKFPSSSSFNEKDGRHTTAGTESSSHSESNTTESAAQNDTLFGKFKSTFSSASPVVSSAFHKLKEAKLSDMAKKGYDIVKDELSSNSSRRKRYQYSSAPQSSEVRSMKTDIVVMPSKQSRLGEKWESFKKKVQGTQLFKRISGLSEPVVTKGQELAEDVRERWETSDHPVVHKIQDLNESVFGETSTALSFKEIRRRDPYFSLPDFLVEVQEMVRPVLTAYLKGDVETLKKYCSSEVIERCKGERMAYESQDIFFDSKILHISEVDVRETKMMGSTPIIIIGFQTQQIYCVRDREGSIKEGGTDTIQTVYYAWAMQQMDAQELGQETLYPIWKLREMQQIGTQALI